MNLNIQKKSSQTNLYSRQSAVLDRIVVDKTGDSFENLSASPTNSIISDTMPKTPVSVSSKIKFKMDPHFKFVKEISFMKKFIEIRKVTIVENIFSQIFKIDNIFDMLY